jgi:hypothetical protein
LLVAVGRDVCRIEKLAMPDTADSTPGLVRSDHPTAEVRLVEALAHESLDVRALMRDLKLTREQPCILVQSQQELTSVLQVINDVDGSMRNEHPVLYFPQQDDRDAQLKGSAHLRVVAIDRASAI